MRQGAAGRAHVTQLALLASSSSRYHCKGMAAIVMRAKVRPHVKNLALLSAYQVLRDEGVEILLAAGECFSHDDDDGMMTMMMGSR